ncbi:MAG: carbamoyltransferase HypF [Thermoplasmata archaeon]
MKFTRIVFFGVVQGVGFRPTAYRVARTMGLKGYVRNNGSNVEVVVDGRAREYVDALKRALPPLARIEEVRYESADESAVLRALGRRAVEGFSIVHSRSGSRVSPIPPDTAICDSCLKELLDPSDRRYLFPFTNCTDCGARFSVIRDVPYDRRNTSMDEFPLCPLCRAEYTSPDDRRFHAQTISCPRDGPQYVLHDAKGRVLASGLEAIGEAARRIDAGQIGVVKGWGGMHIVCRLEECTRLRKWYRRPAKPFAVMFRNLEAAKRVADVDDFAERLLTSPQRPIVVLPRTKASLAIGHEPCETRERGEGGGEAGGGFDAEGEVGETGAGGDAVLDCVSPGLGSIGCYLPYSGLHHVLFSMMRSDAIIMTSANPAGEPMLIKNEEAFSLGLDFYLLHNRTIVSRTDDSVLIPFRGRRFFIRKSRGWVPDGIPVPYKSRVLSMGAERNVTSAVSKDGRLYATQYIGNTTRYSVQLFQESATRHLMRLLGVQSIERVVVDLHPQYATRKLGAELAREWGAEVDEVQHHWAHAASLMLDNGVERDERLVCIAADGAGYGADGTVWGGEILLASYRGFERVGTLESFPLLGGDAAVRDPPRLVLALLGQAGVDWREWEHQSLLERDRAEVLLRLKGSSPLTSSLGRVLDAISCYLGVGKARTYDGEPAIRLELYLEKGRAVHRFEMEELGGGGTCATRVIPVTPLFRQLHMAVKGRVLTERERADWARSIVESLVGQMVDVAAEAAEREGLRRIGWTGGVSYNIPITEMVVRRVRERGLEPLLHDRIPNGDGGISAGQNVIIGISES